MLKLTDLLKMAEERLVNHSVCERHPEKNPDADCPFCEDRKVWRLIHDKLYPNRSPTTPFTGESYAHTPTFGDYANSPSRFS